MYLLYCDTNGVVVAYHTDDETAVPMEDYQGVVRIVPYDQPLSTLERVGDPPPPTERGEYQPDNRPYKQPDPTPDLLKLYAGQVRYNYNSGGFQFNAASGVIPVWSDRMSYMLVQGLGSYANTVPNNTVLHFTQGATDYLITAAEAKSLLAAFSLRIQQYRGVEAQCIGDLNKPTPAIKTYDDVDSLFAGVVQGSQRRFVRPRMKG